MPVKKLLDECRQSYYDNNYSEETKNELKNNFKQTLKIDD